MAISAKKAKRERKRRREANERAAKLAARQVPLPPAERDEVNVEELRAMLRSSDNVRDIPLGLLRVHPVHGDRDPYKDSPAGLKRRTRCAAHIRRSGGWNDIACEVLTVCESGDGFYDVINGIGRLYMADMLSGGVVKVLTCRVLKRLTPAQVEKAFEIMGTENTKISPYDVWRSKINHRGPEGDEVRAIVAIEEQFGKSLPVVKLPTKRWGHSLGVLDRALALVSNTSLGADKRYTNIFTSMTVALLASNPKLDEKRFRHVAGEGNTLNENLPGWLFDRAQRKANTKGYLKPHTRTVAWIAAEIFAEEMYNANISQSKWLDVDALAKLNVPTEFYDAYSSAPPRPKRNRFRVVKTDAAVGE